MTDETRRSEGRNSSPTASSSRDKHRERRRQTKRERQRRALWPLLTVNVDQRPPTLDVDETQLARPDEPAGPRLLLRCPEALRGSRSWTRGCHLPWGDEAQVACQQGAEEMQDRVRRVDREEVRECRDEAGDEEEEEDHRQHAIHRVDVALCQTTDDQERTQHEVRDVVQRVHLEETKQYPLARLIRRRRDPRDKAGNADDEIDDAERQGNLLNNPTIHGSKALFQWWP